MLKGSIHQDDIKIINIYVPTNRARKHLKQKWTELKGEVDSSIIGGPVNTLLSVTGRTTRQKIVKETESLNNTVIS